MLLAWLLLLLLLLVRRLLLIWRLLFLRRPLPVWRLLRIRLRLPELFSDGCLTNRGKLFRNVWLLARQPASRRADVVDLFKASLDRSAKW